MTRAQPDYPVRALAAQLHFKALTDAAAVAEEFLGSRTRAGLHDLLRELFVVQTINRWRADNALKQEEPLDCGPGCAWCCYQSVAVSAPEVLVISDHLHATLPAHDLGELADRTREAASRLAGLNAHDRFLLKEPCVLLVAGRCLVYDLRPLVCRGENSLRAATCQTAFEDAAPEGAATLSLESHRAVAAGVLWGMVDVMAEAGLEAGPFELTQALAIALGLEHAMERWLAGEPLFSAARWQG